MEKRAATLKATEAANIHADSIVNYSNGYSSSTLKMTANAYQNEYLQNYMRGQSWNADVDYLSANLSTNSSSYSSVYSGQNITSSEAKNTKTNDNRNILIDTQNEQVIQQAYFTPEIFQKTFAIIQDIGQRIQALNAMIKFRTAISIRQPQIIYIRARIQSAKKFNSDSIKICSAKIDPNNSKFQYLSRVIEVFTDANESLDKLLESIK